MEETMSGEDFRDDVVNDDTTFSEDQNLEGDEKIGDWSFGTEQSNTDYERPEENIYDMTQALEEAESRCNSLKEELDIVKYYYKDSCTQDGPGDYIDDRKLYRQNSDAISTDHTGAAVVTINNILTGITESINRLSELHSTGDVDHFHYGRRRKHGRKSSRVRSNIEIIEEECHVVPSGCNFKRTNSATSQLKRKEQKRRTKRRSVIDADSSQSIIQIQEKPKVVAGPQPFTKVETGRGESSSSIKYKRPLKRLRQTSRTSVSRRNKVCSKGEGSGSKNLVEIYHNVAAKSSESDENADEEQHSAVRNSVIEVKPRSKRLLNYISDSVKNVENRALSPIQERIDSFDHGNEYEYNVVHSYETPTIASRMKQVARSYFHPLNTKAIPFCAAKSTSPSHNIGINIQQVMSIIKSRQPIKGISPTLAHNIGLAAEKLNPKSMSAIASSFGSKFVAYNQLPCPANKGSSANYEQLKEMAKEVTDEDCEIEEIQCDNETNEAQQHNQMWAIDPTHQLNCTCIQQKGVEFQQILNKYGPCTQQISGVPQSQYAQKILKRSQKKYQHIKSVYAQPNGSKKHHEPNTSADEQSYVDNHLQLKGKEKLLKSVLLNLHDEFKQLNDKYETLSRNISHRPCEDVNPEDAKELEWLEKKLNDKELEIQMVMSLYTEVVRLKQQVKVLREKASMASLLIEQQKQQCQQNYQQQCQQWSSQQQVSQKPKDPRTSNAALHLTKLLRKIRLYQDGQGKFVGK